MSLSMAGQNLRESLYMPQLPKGFQQLGPAQRGERVSVGVVRSAAVRGRTDSKGKSKSKRGFYDSVERSYAKKGSYFRRKDDVAKERQQEARIMTRDSTQMRSVGFFRVFGVEVLLESDLGKDYFEVSDAVLESTAVALRCEPGILPRSGLTVLRKSFDARKEPKFVYTVELDIEECLKQNPASSSFLSKLRAKPARLEFSKTPWAPVDVISALARQGESLSTSSSTELEVESSDHLQGPGLEQRGTSDASTTGRRPGQERSKVVVVGSGPAGLFAALVLAESGAKVTLVERGQPVEGRGKDIGALMVRRLLNAESNLCYGEGGAGTWSDGKLTTRIGKNGGSVQAVLATLVRFGAPASILMNGKPHVGTDRLIHILRAFRQHLHSLGVTLLFGTRMDDLIVRDGRVVGIKVSPVTENLESAQATTLEADAVILGVGHSARDVYENLHSHNVLMTPKDFAVGLRVEHPQELINEMQYHKWASEVQRGKGKVPVADYRVAANINAGKSDEDVLSRGCFSFCMCPGGQIVPTSTNESELCINGMSFSKRSSKWANAALVVSVPSEDFEPLISEHGPLAGIAFQRALEREAAILGGGKLVAPAQTIPDFLDDKLSGKELPSSSYRLGVRASPLHELLPSHLTHALKEALVAFDGQLPGFITEHGLLHGIETRTSSPVRIDRDKDTFESVSLPGLFPVGEGAGYAGGIVSAAVDGMHAGFALAKQFNPEFQTAPSDFGLRD
ncbi:hypothetical protein KC19_12G039300 [Ceratodon purpureus]|uniref:Uncharacterized protein n=1 Tax=Ceratodon purpureus TaxID=3225 RepID=A0A8T0G3Z8_CERPU|nr:hypothetical protein KC19_12G039300 [Ceratodon purpureus]